MEVKDWKRFEGESEKILPSLVYERDICYIFFLDSKSLILLLNFDTRSVTLSLGTEGIRTPLDSQLVFLV